MTPLEFSPSLGIQVTEAKIMFKKGDIIMVKDVVPFRMGLAPTSPVKKLAVYFGTGGAVKTEFTLFTQSEGVTVYGQIYKNGVPAGVQRSTSSAAGETFAEDFEGLVAGNELQLYLWSSDAGVWFRVDPLYIKVASFDFARVEKF